MIKWILISLAALLCGLAIHLYLHLGFREDVRILGLIKKDFHFIGQKHVGPYHKINSRITNVEQWAFNQGWTCTNTYGYYIDDPRASEEDRLRSEGGCLVDVEPTQSQLADLNGFEYKYIPSREYLALEFEGSPAIGPMKVYPKAEEWFLKKRLKMVRPIIEIYKNTGPNQLATTYYFPIQ